MEKKMYNKPEVEIVEVQGANIMLKVSVNGDYKDSIDSIPGAD